LSASSTTREPLDPGSEDNARGVSHLHVRVRHDEIIGHHGEDGGLVVGKQEIGRRDESLDRPALRDRESVVAVAFGHPLRNCLHRLVGTHGLDIAGHVLADGRFPAHRATLAPAD